MIIRRPHTIRHRRQTARATACALLTTLCCSCMNEITFSEEESAHKPVVNCIIGNEGRVWAQVYESSFFLDDIASGSFYPTRDDAEVSLWRNGEFMEKLAYHSGERTYYTRYGVFLEAGNEVEIRVEADGWQEARGKTVMPAKVEDLHVDTKIVRYKQSIYKPEDVYMKYKFKLKFRDNPDEENFYRLATTVIYYDRNDQPSYDITLALRLDDPVFEVEQDLTGGYLSEYLHTNKYHIFSDRTFNGQNYELDFSIDKTKTQYDESLSYAWQLVRIDLQHISKDYYQYLKTREAAERKALLPELFSEPVLIYHNIQNGIGIMGGYMSNEIEEIVPIALSLHPPKAHEQ